MGQPEGDGREPERAHHPEAVPDGSPHPASLGIQRGCFVRRSSKEGGGCGQISHETIELTTLITACPDPRPWDDSLIAGRLGRTPNVATYALLARPTMPCGFRGS